jgi:peroxiredoxin/predicted 2-oxoglutarate/Fe(II)-dependent dioxygenase YbiX
MPTTPPQIGDPIHPFRLQNVDDQPFDLTKHVGRYIVLFFFVDSRSAECREQVAAFNILHEQFLQHQATVVGIGVDPADVHKAMAEELGLRLPVVSDTTGAVCIAFGAARPEPAHDRPTVSVGRMAVLIDTTFRIARIYEQLPPADYAAQALADLAAMATRERPRQLLQHAPVLIVPNILPPNVCEELMRVWEQQGNEDSGFMRQVDGKTVGAIDYNHKIRRDHFLARGELEERLKMFVGTRVVPEIRKAFNFAVTRREDFRIACYDSSRGGYFRPHRDNTTEGTAHRRFAMSLLLNDDYDGGHLRFPEYAPHHYKPEAGAAVIFSCSLLHEATNVIRGRRFVLLSFFYGEQEARLRERYNERTGGGYRA